MYNLLKIIVRFSLFAYFRKITIRGRDKISKTGPYVLISNHPSAFMDPISVVTHVKPTLYFLAAGEYMGKGFKYWFMNKVFKMIPVYRPETMPDQAHQNTAIFDKCIEHLHKGRCILVFPEGVSKMEQKILPLKTGVARIVRATELAKNLNANVQVVPVGLNYSDPHKFRSDLFINVGDPIKASDYFTNDPQKEQEEVKALTQKMEEELIQTVLHMEDLEFEDLLSKVNETYMRDLKSELGVDYMDQQKEFELNQLTISAFKYFQENEPDKFELMKARIDSYFNLLGENSIKDREFRKVDEKSKWHQKILLIIGAPLYLVGLIGNVVPYEVAKMLQRRFSVKDTFRGSIVLAIGMVMFILWYSLLVTALWVLTPLSYWALLVPAVLYISGLHALIYNSVYRYLAKRRKLRSYLQNTPGLRNKLDEARQHLIDNFSEMRAEFRAKR